MANEQEITFDQTKAVITRLAQLIDEQPLTAKERENLHIGISMLVTKAFPAEIKALEQKQEQKQEQANKPTASKKRAKKKAVKKVVKKATKKAVKK